MSRPGLHFADDVPLHHQVYELVRGDILDGLYIGRDDFPGEAELARLFQVSVATSRMVLQRLANEGLIVRGRGRRSQAVYVPHDDSVTPLTVNLDLFTFRLLDISEERAPWPACRALGLPGGATTWRCMRLRFRDARPHSVTYHYQADAIGRRHDVEALGVTPMPRLLAAAGLSTMRIDCIVGVRRPPPAVSAALGVDVWDKLLVTTLTSFSHDGQPTDHARVFFHPDEQHSLESVANDALIDDAARNASAGSIAD